MLILIIVAEVALRIPAVTTLLPDPTQRLWHALLIQEKLDYLARAEDEHGVDVLFIGNSTTQAGVNPAIFDQARFGPCPLCISPNVWGEDGPAPSLPLKGEELSGPPPSRPLKGEELSREEWQRVSFNAAIEGLPPFGNEMFLAIFLKRAFPETIIYGVSAQDLNSNSPWAADVTERVNHSPLALAESGRGLRGWFVGSLLKVSQLYRYRPILLQMIITGSKQTSHLEEVFFDERGHDAIDHKLSDVPQSDRGYLYNNAGVLNYGITGLQTDSLIQLLEETQALGIEPILVNMPLADDYYGNFDQVEDYAAYLNAMKTIAAEQGIFFWDMEDLGDEDFGDDEFADFNHLNAAGAERLSRMLAERVTK